MDRPIRKKKPEQAPDWLIYSLKGLLLFLLFWNINRQFPNGIFSVVEKTKRPQAIYATPYIEEVSYNQLLSTTKPKVYHYIRWGEKEIPFIDPELTATNTPYVTLSQKELTKIMVNSFDLVYKGYLLKPNKFNAIFIQADSTFTICKDLESLNTCFYPTLKELKTPFALWLAIETEEEKTFFTKIKVGDFTNIGKEEVQRYWKKLINRDKHKNIDNLTVVKPIFKNHEYLFKWGEWERFAHGPRGGRRVKIGLKDFQEWVNQQPYLYKQKEFIPFNISINFWTKAKRGHKRCFISRKEKEAPIISNNECFKNLLEKVEVGDILSIFIFTKDDYLKKLSSKTLKALPHFVINDQIIQFSIPIEIVAENFDPQNAPLKLTTSNFSFQLNSSLGKNAIVKMDTDNPKNEALQKHYSDSKSAKIIPISDFKTVRRVITENDIFIPQEEIEKTYTLIDKVFKIETFPEFYDFNIQPPLLKFRNLSTVLDKTAYPLKDFKRSKKEFELFIGSEKVNILQIQFTVIPKTGKAIQYITNSLDRADIRRRLRKLQPETSLYFDNILFERANGEQMVFPLATALHLK